MEEALTPLIRDIDIFYELIFSKFLSGNRCPVCGFYGNIKRVCETELGIVSLCCLLKNVVKGNKQYLKNVALKIKVKFGGTNTLLESTLLRNGPDRNPFLADKLTIIFGADVKHPPPGEDSSPSIAAVVASMNWPTATKYKGLVCVQHHRQEIISDMFTKRTDTQKGTSVRRHD